MSVLKNHLESLGRFDTTISTLEDGSILVTDREYDAYACEGVRETPYIIDVSRSSTTFNNYIPSAEYKKEPVKIEDYHKHTKNCDNCGASRHSHSQVNCNYCGSLLEKPDRKRVMGLPEPVQKKKPQPEQTKRGVWTWIVIFIGVFAAMYVVGFAYKKWKEKKDLESRLKLKRT